MLLLLDHSTSDGQIGLARNDQLIATRPIPPRRRHNVDLMVAVAELCAQQHVTPANLTGVAVTLGPGSFTGLRVAVATAKMLALTSRRPDFRTFGVPNLDLLHAQHPEALIALNIKRGTAWSVGPDRLDLPPAWRDVDELQRLADEHHLPIHAEKLDHARPPTPELATLLRLIQPTPHADAEERQRSDEASGPPPTGYQIDPLHLAPAYLREPEAVTLWNEARSRT
jgi:tRNA threonylcarbamoyl adenosine modification protein YeaZ